MKTTNREILLAGGRQHLRRKRLNHITVHTTLRRSAAKPPKQSQPRSAKPKVCVPTISRIPNHVHLLWWLTLEPAGSAAADSVFDKDTFTNLNRPTRQSRQTRSIPGFDTAIHTCVIYTRSRSSSDRAAGTVCIYMSLTLCDRAPPRCR